jgi:uncharacterized membrane protein SpoIIM required for sporulation
MKIPAIILAVAAGLNFLSGLMYAVIGNWLSCVLQIIAGAGLAYSSYVFLA